MAAEHGHKGATTAVGAARPLTPSLWQQTRDRIDHIARDSPARLPAGENLDALVDGLTRLGGAG